MTSQESSDIRNTFQLIQEVRRWRLLAVCAVAVAMVLGLTLLAGVL
jgi:hypothetical protein